METTQSPRPRSSIGNSLPLWAYTIILPKAVFLLKTSLYCIASGDLARMRGGALGDGDRVCSFLVILKALVATKNISSGWSTTLLPLGLGRTIFKVRLLYAWVKAIQLLGSTGSRILEGMPTACPDSLELLSQLFSRRTLTGSVETGRPWEDWTISLYTVVQEQAQSSWWGGNDSSLMG